MNNTEIQPKNGSARVPLDTFVMQGFCNELRKAAKCVYLATEEGVARDLSDKLNKSARLLELMSGTVSTHLYNSGYEAGHHDTVEGCFTPVFSQDMDTYQDDVVGELLGDLLNDEEGA